MSQKKCNQSKNHAVLNVGGIFLCLDCYAKFQQANYQRHVMLASTINMLLDDADYMMGVPRMGGRFKIPTPTTINAGPTTLNNIRVNDSVVGTINTGNVEKLDSRVSAMKSENRHELANAIQHLTQSILNASDIKPSDKDSAIECLSFLSDQALTPEKERQPTVGKTIISKLEQILTNTGSVASLWAAVEPIISNLF